MHFVPGRNCIQVLLYRGTATHWYKGTFPSKHAVLTAKVLKSDCALRFDVSGSAGGQIILMDAFPPNV